MMSDPRTYADERGSSRLPLVAWALIAVLFFGFVGLGPFTAPPEKAAGAALTNVRNGGTPGTTSSFVTIRKDNGVVIDLNPQQIQWGVRSYIVRNGTCVRRNGGSPICATSGSREFALPSGSSNTLVRTK